MVLSAGIGSHAMHLSPSALLLKVAENTDDLTILRGWYELVKRSTDLIMHVRIQHSQVAREALAYDCNVVPVFHDFRAKDVVHANELCVKQKFDETL